MSGINGRRLALVLFFLVCLWAGALAAPVASVHSLSGAVTVRPAGKTNLLALAVGVKLQENDIVATGPGGKVAILFTDGSLVCLAPRSSIQLRSSTHTSPKQGRSTTSLFIALFGELWARIRPGKGAQTRSAVAGVRGTEIRLQVEPEGATTLTVLDGEVDFFNDYGAVLVEQSQQSTAHPDAAPTIPVTVANAGIPVEWTLDLQRVLIPRETFLSETSLEAARQRAQAHPEEAAAHQQYGEALYDAGEYSRALHELEAAKRLRFDLHTLTDLGSTLFALHRLEDAERTYGDVEPRSSSAAPALVGLAWIELQRNHWREARRDAEDALARDPGAAEAAIVLGLTLMRQGGADEQAWAVFQRVPDGPYHYQADAWQALLALAKSDTANALTLAERAVHARPTSALAQGNLALVRFFTGDLPGARRAAQAALKANPDSVAAHCILGQAQLALGEVDAAANTIAYATALDPGQPQSQYFLGVADAQRGDYLHAVHALRACLRLAPAFMPAYQALAIVYLRMGHRDDALALVEALPTQYPQSAMSRLALGQVDTRLGRFAQAERAYRDALALESRSALAQAALAEVLLADHQLQPALLAARRAVALAPGIADYWATLGRCYEYSRLFTLSDQAYREALRLDPETALPRARLALAAPDAHTKLNGVTQAFLIDPAVSSQFLRPDVSTELTPALGVDANAVDLANQFVGFSGVLHGFTLYAHARNDDVYGRINDDQDTSVFSTYLTCTPAPRLNLFLNLSHTRLARGLPGPHIDGLGDDPDDRDETLLDVGQVAARWRFANGAHLWAGVTCTPSRTETDDPDMQSSGFLDQVTRTQTVIPEWRLDLPLPRRTGRDEVLILGMARILERATVTTDTFDPLLLTPATEWQRMRETASLAYGQVTHPLGHNATLTLQLQGERTHSTQTAGNPAAMTDDRLLPGLQLTWRAGARTLVNLTAQQQSTVAQQAAFNPLNTVLTLPAEAQPNGAPDRTRAVVLDITRLLGDRQVLQCLLYQTSAKEVFFGGPSLPAAVADSLTLPRLERTGGKLRYEFQVGRALFAAASLAVNRTTLGGTDTLAPYQPRLRSELEAGYFFGKRAQLHLNIIHLGAFYQDSAMPDTPRRRFPAETYVNGSFNWQLSYRCEWFINCTNLFARPQIDFADFPAAQRQWESGVTWRL